VQTRAIGISGSLLSGTKHAVGFRGKGNLNGTPGLGKNGILEKRKAVFKWGSKHRKFPTRVEGERD